MPGGSQVRATRTFRIQIEHEHVHEHVYVISGRT